MISRLMKFFILALLAFTACKKNETLPTIEEYLASNNLTNSVVKDPRGFYYKIQEPGSGTTPTLTSRVKTLYKGMLTNGTVFDQSLTTPIEFTLNGVIAGWQYGIPLIKPGGRITLYLPPSLGYGPYGTGPIPGNAGLIFEVTLISVN
jgi:FKBP-type peptidyl-prolyl cis-trans isomerase FkpA